MSVSESFIQGQTSTRVVTTQYGIVVGLRMRDDVTRSEDSTKWVLT